jgi:hypothetical protein
MELVQNRAQRLALVDTDLLHMLNVWVILQEKKELLKSLTFLKYVEFSWTASVV